MLKNFIGYAKTRKYIVLAFVLSTITFFILFYLLPYISSRVSEPDPLQNPDIVIIGSIVAISTSCITSIATFFGLIFTWVIGWRKENRETKASMLERERLQTAIERERLELEKLKVENKKLKKK